MGLPSQRLSASDVDKQCQGGNRFPVLNGLVKPLIEYSLNEFIMDNNNSKQILLLVVESSDLSLNCTSCFNLASSEVQRKTGSDAEANN